MKKKIFQILVFPIFCLFVLGLPVRSYNCPTGVQNPITSGSVAKKICPSICPYNGWNGNWACPGGTNCVCGCEYPCSSSSEAKQQTITPRHGEKN